MKIGAAQTTDLRVGVREQAPLQKRVVREIYARNDMTRMKRNLLRFREKIIRIAVERHFADDLHRHQFFRHEFRRIEQVETEFVLVGLLDDLNT